MSRRQHREIPPSLVKALSLTTGGDELLAADGTGLKRVRERIDQFFTDASSAPPAQCIESDERRRGDDATPDASHDSEEAEHEVHLSLIAGVLEAKKGPQLQQVDGVVLPTPGNLERLDAEKMRDSHALLNMFAALRNPTHSGDVDSHKRRRDLKQRPTGGNGDDEGDDASSLSSECVYMNASSCSEGTSGDEAVAGQKQSPQKWVLELS